MTNWKAITRKAVGDMRAKRIAVVPLHRNAIPPGYRLIGIGKHFGLELPAHDEFLARAMRRVLWDLRRTRTIQRSDAAVWLIRTDDDEEAVMGLGQLMSPSHPVFERWARKGGLFA